VDTAQSERGQPWTGSELNLGGRSKRGPKSLSEMPVINPQAMALSMKAGRVTKKCLESRYLKKVIISSGVLLDLLAQV
jgi:hypothetical protein